MNEFEKSMLRLESLQRDYTAIPDWARAEQMEKSVPLCSIWEMAARIKKDGMIRLMVNSLPHRQKRGLP